MAKPKFVPPAPAIWRSTVNFDGTHARPGESQQHMRTLVHFRIPTGKVELRDMDVRTVIAGLRELVQTSAGARQTSTGDRY